MRTLRSARSWSAVWLSALLVVAAACASPAAPGRAGPAAAEAGAGPGAAEAGRAGAAATEAPPPLEPVKVAYVNALDNAPLFVGIDRGYWQAEGIDVQTEPVQSAADAVAFLAHGQLEVGGGPVRGALF